MKKILAVLSIILGLMIVGNINLYKEDPIVDIQSVNQLEHLKEKFLEYYKVLSHTNSFGVEYIQVPKLEGNFITVNFTLLYGDELYFKKIIETVDIDGVLLNSQGGNLDAGMRIAEIVHAYGLPVYIPEEGECFSACSIIYLAGKDRYSHSTGLLGVHRAWSYGPNKPPEAVDLSDLQANAIMAYYYGIYGAPFELVFFATQTPPWDITYDSPKYFLDDVIEVDK